MKIILHSIFLHSILYYFLYYNFLVINLLILTNTDTYTDSNTNINTNTNYNNIYLINCIRYKTTTKTNLLSTKSKKIHNHNSNSNNNYPTTHLLDIPTSPYKLDSIILNAIKSNPKSSIQSIVPKLNQVLTKQGLKCDFPFKYNEIDYFNHCAKFPDNQFYCKINTDIKDLLLDKFKHIVTDGENLLFDKCVEIDETEKLINSLIEKKLFISE